MPTLSLAYRLRAPAPLPAHPKAVLVADTGLRVVLPYAPRVVEHDGLADQWTELGRQGRKALVRRTASGLHVMAFTALLARRDHQQPVEDLLDAFRKLGESGARITVALSPLESGVWRLTGLKVSSELRQHGTNAVTRATVALSFTEAVDAVVAVGPLTGGAAASPAVPASPTARTHVVKAGETLAAIAGRFYGKANDWPKIATANGIRDPRTLRVGATLTIPPA